MFNRRTLFGSRGLGTLLGLLCLSLLVVAQTPYQKPPKAILDVLNAPNPPQVSISPTGDRMMLLESERYPSIADLSEPMLRIAGLRINPVTNGPRLAQRVTGLTLRNIADGKEIKLAVPANARIGFGRGGGGGGPFGGGGGGGWSPDGKHFAFTNTTATGIEIWVGNAATGAIRRIPGVRLNAAYGEAWQWMPDNRTLLCQIVPAGRGRPPAAPKVPNGPTIQESYGKAAQVRTYEDLLQNAHDEDLFDYYATSQLALVNVGGGLVMPIGKPAIIVSSDPSPDGQHFLVTTNHKPYTYIAPSSAFPREVEVWDRHGKLEHKVASIPLNEGGGGQGFGPGGDQGQDDASLSRPRFYQWRPTEPATLVWVVGIREGSANSGGANQQGSNRRPTRDRLLALKAPFKGEPIELYKTEQRFGGLTWGEKGLALLRESEPFQGRGGGQTGPGDAEQGRGGGQGGRGRTLLINLDDSTQKPRIIWDRSGPQSRYTDPGQPVMRQLANGRRILWQNGNQILLNGNGATPEGDRPFLDRFDLATLKSERLFRCDDKSYESFVTLISEDGSRFITRYETPTEPPNYYIRTAAQANKQALTNFTDPAPQLRGISKQLVKYKRADGVDLSFTLYLPPDYKPGTRLPTVVWAYPREFEDANTAGEVSGSPNRFTSISGMSHLFFVLQGYAVLDNAAMPVVGNSRTVNDTFVEQIVAAAKAAIDKAVEMGVTDRNRVGVGGHSYGAFMTANLLAHSELFRAGIARSGAYNRTLTPFGFQNERRTFWQAQETYQKMSPFWYADKIKEPILLIHGEADDNSGTFPIQTERLYQAIKGNGGNVRYVTLPHEPHGYQAKESLMHTLYEMTTWFDKHVKNATEAPAAAAATANGKQ
jgi:dipeptidyl aminopeptidase/acylaminoacyl peptidase